LRINRKYLFPAENERVMGNPVRGFRGTIFRCVNFAGRNHPSSSRVLMASIQHSLRLEAVTEGSTLADQVYSSMKKSISMAICDWSNDLMAADRMMGR
jgi:hypothetical protein